MRQMRSASANLQQAMEPPLPLEAMSYLDTTRFLAAWLIGIAFGLDDLAGAVRDLWDKLDRIERRMAGAEVSRGPARLKTTEVVKAYLNTALRNEVVS